MAIYSTVLLTRASAECVVKAEKSQLPTPRGGFFVAFGSNSLTHSFLLSRVFRGINRRFGLDFYSLNKYSTCYFFENVGQTKALLRDIYSWVK